MRYDIKAGRWQSKMRFEIREKFSKKKFKAWRFRSKGESENEPQQQIEKLKLQVVH